MEMTKAKYPRNNKAINAQPFQPAFSNFQGLWITGSSVERKRYKLKLDYYRVAETMKKSIAIKPWGS